MELQKSLQEIMSELEAYKRADIEKNQRILLLETYIAQLNRQRQGEAKDVQTECWPYPEERGEQHAETHSVSVCTDCRPTATACFQVSPETADFAQYHCAEPQKELPPANYQQYTPAESLIGRLQAIKKYLVMSEMKLADLVRVCVRDGKKSRLISCAYVDKLFEIQHLKMLALDTAVKSLESYELLRQLSFSRDKVSFQLIEQLTRGRSLFSRIIIVDQEAFLEGELGSFQKTKDGRIGYSKV